MEHWEELKPGGFRFCWDDALFPAGTDTFLLSSLPRLRPGLRVCDLGCGTGLLGLLLLQRERGLSVTGVEVNPRAAALGARCAAENGLGEDLRILQGDLREVRSFLPAGSFDLAVCNPPYYPPSSGAVSPRAGRSAARTELLCTLEDVCRAGAYLLRWGGALCLVHKPERLCDAMCALRAAGLEPKQLRLVCRDTHAIPSLVLLEGRRGGKPGLRVEAPLLLQTEGGGPTAEADAIYFRNQEDRA